MDDLNIEEVIAKAKNQRRQKLFEQRVALLKAEDAFNELGGKDDYELSLSAIVTAYPGGISLTRVREFFPESKELDAAVENLANKKLIEVGDKKRSPLLKPLKPVSNAKGDGEEPKEFQAPVPSPKKLAPKTNKTTEENAEE